MYLFIGERSRAAAERWVDAVEDTVRMLVENPALGRRRVVRSRVAGGVRSLAVRGFGAYLLFYRAAADSVEVVRLIHGARDFPTLFEEE